MNSPFLLSISSSKSSQNLVSFICEPLTTDWIYIYIFFGRGDFFFFLVRFFFFSSSLLLGVSSSSLVFLFLSPVREILATSPYSLNHPASFDIPLEICFFLVSSFILCGSLILSSYRSEGFMGWLPTSHPGILLY